MADVLRAFGLTKTTPGNKKVYLTDESQQKTYVTQMNEDGDAGTGFKLFTEHGGEGVTSDAEGNVYLAAGQIYIYRPDGTLLRTVDVPDRPINLVIGGPGESYSLHSGAKVLFMRCRYV